MARFVTVNGSVAFRVVSEARLEKLARPVKTWVTATAGSEKVRSAGDIPR